MLRKRARKACLPCHKRKVRCNGEHPCNICEGYGYDCAYASGLERPAKRAQGEAGETTTPVPDVPAAVRSGPLDLTRAQRSDADASNDSARPGKPFVLVEVPNRKALKLSTAPFPESLISRYTTVYSAAAFPRELGQSLGLTDAPRLHCFAWNTGTREEKAPPLGHRLFDQISLQDALKYLKVYFEHIQPVFGFLSSSHATQVCIDAWDLRQMPIDVEATVCGAIALGSLFCANKTPWEFEYSVLQQAQHLLEISVSHPPSQLSLKFVMAWILRAVYLRCTTRPHLSWMASCNAVHVAESMGLHQEFRNMCALHQRSPETICAETECRHETFWIALSLNRLFSVEYGRSPLQLDTLSCLPPTKEHNLGATVDFVKLCELLPGPHQQVVHSNGEQGSLATCLEQLAQFDVQAPPLTLFKTEICFTIFRRMRFLHMTMTAPQIETILDMIRAALLEAKQLSDRTSKWWNVVGVPFQSICVLVALDSSSSVAMLPDAMRTLEAIASSYDTHLVREALQTAAQIVQGLRKKKMEEVQDIDRALEVGGCDKISNNHGLNDQPLSEPTLGFDWPIEYDGGWMELLLNNDTL
ncbi:MAG: hypothetical protein M1821_000944 [Bathelium mastoideum]|nr:MAG: hypothetical protein M1821_000944 [Bathelium mastoideum]